MVTKRTPLRRNHVVRITPQLLATWSIIRETHDDDARSDEFREASKRLDELLDRSPWMESVESTLDEDTPPDYIIKAGELRLNSWKHAHAIRVQLDEALSVAGRRSHERR